MKLEHYSRRFEMQLRHWLQLRGFGPELVADLPQLGYIVDNVAAGFIANAEFKFGIMDSFVTNPAATSEDRNEALTAIIERLIQDAKALGLKRLLAFSTDEGILKRQQHYGFAQLPNKLTILELKGE